jgi:putative ATP-binding cassette transporter
MDLIAFLLRASRGVVVLSVLAGLAGGIAGVGLIALIRDELARETARPAAMAWAFAGLCVAAGAARIAAQIAIIRLGQGAVANLGVHLVRRIILLPLRAFESIDTAALLAALTEDITIIANALVGLPHLCINVPIVIACLAYIGWLSPPVFACGVAFAALAIVAYVALTARGIRCMYRARERQDVVVGHFRTAIAGFRELKLHRGRRVAFLAESLEPDVARARAEMVGGLTDFAIADGWGQTAFFAFIGVLLFGVAGLAPITRPTLVSAVLVVLYLMTPLDVILTWVPALGRARASLRKIQALLPEIERQAESEPGRPALPRQPESVKSVSLERATFTYSDAHEDRGFTLGPLDMTLRRGEIVILAGGNGSGKTTLVKLISGLYAPQQGILRLDGRGLHDEDREAYRQLVSVVFADGHLFPDFRGFGRDGLESRARDGLKDLGLADRVSVQGGSFSTTDLSQGQRRRLALLGALLEDRPILILDEWAANQDPAFKPFFYRSLLPELRAEGRAILVISHDEPHFDVADRVLRLQDGRLLEESRVGCGGAWA